MWSLYVLKFWKAADNSLQIHFTLKKPSDVNPNVPSYHASDSSARTNSQQLQQLFDNCLRPPKTLNTTSLDVTILLINAWFHLISEKD